MTVRAKTELAKALTLPGLKAIWARSNVTGELQIQVEDDSGHMIPVFIRSSGGGAAAPVNLLLFASAEKWRKSRSFLSAVRAGHIAVTLAKEGANPSS